MHHDVVIIGAGMSGLAAGIRVAHFDKRVCILEKHYAFGGLNSYYKIGRREFDVGLHAVTNFCGPERRNAPLSKLLRQLRLTREDFDLRPQRHSEVRFPSARLRFSNDVRLLIEEVAQAFPREVDRFRRLVRALEVYDDVRLDAPYSSARATLRDRLGDPMLIEMLLCPVMYYGSAEEHDLDFTQFVTMFKALFLEGFARPREGVRRIVKTLVRRFRPAGGELRIPPPVRRILVDGGRARGVELESGETITADVVLSSAGFVETMRLCPDSAPAPADNEIGCVSFVEAIAVLDTPPAALGHDAAVMFYNDADAFEYARPAGIVDCRSGVICCPNNYQGHEDMSEGVFRMTWLADYSQWARLGQVEYQSAKRECEERFLEHAARFVAPIRRHVVCTDLFTPRTIERYTGHLNGAVYGSPRKRRDGRTPVENLYVCGTDQGFLGIVGAMLSGITMANVHVLERD